VDAVSDVVYARSPGKKGKKKQTTAGRDAKRVKTAGKGKGTMQGSEGEGYLGGKGKSDAFATWPEPNTSGTQLVAKLADSLEVPFALPDRGGSVTDLTSAVSALGKGSQIPQLARAASAPAPPLSAPQSATVEAPSGHSADLGAGWKENSEEVEERVQNNDEEEEDDEEQDDEVEEDEDEGEQLFGKGFMKGHGKTSQGMTSKAKKKKGADEPADPDKLNLAGLLNVLDGVVDSPGRIVVMTTNHPEKLDPALIRPGRINFAIELGFMKAEPLCELIQHIMAEEMTQAQRQKAASLAERCKLTPAQVEQTCAVVSSLDELLEHLSL